METEVTASSSIGTNSNCNKQQQQPIEAQQQQPQQPPATTILTNISNNNNNNNNIGSPNNNDFSKEAQDLKSRTRKLQLEIEEKNEIINVLKEELETLRESSDKYQRDNLQLIKDAKRVKFLQDENDFLQDKVGSLDKLESEIKRLKERLQEAEFFKLRIKELEEDLTKSQEEATQFELKWRETLAKLTRVGELEAELGEWKSFSNDLEKEKNSIQSKLLESIDQETKLQSINEKVEDEVKRLRDLIKSYEEERDETQASNSLIMSVADLKQYDQQKNQISVDVGTDPMEATATTWKRVSVCEEGQQTDVSDTAEKSVGTEAPYPTRLVVEEEQQQQHEQQKKHQNQLNDENKSLKEALSKQESKLNQLANDNEHIRDKLDSNKKMISDLRQDLACEKSLTQKLTSQIASFTKQIKSLDKQYFPMHDTKSSKVDTANQNSSNINETNNSGSVSEPRKNARENIITTTSTNGSSGLAQVSKPMPAMQQAQQQQQQDNMYNHTNGHSNGLTNGHGITNGLNNAAHTNAQTNGQTTTTTTTTNGRVQSHNQNGLSPSRQLNALIDPATHEQLLMGMYQQANINNSNNNGQLLHNGQRLTEQQINHLNNLHRQHYYHHLHQLHQMHHQHHLHHMHHMHHNPANSTTSHQPSIKTSKILNISQQSGSVAAAAVAASAQASMIKQNGGSVGVNGNNGVMPNGNTNGLDNLLSNLASIKLNDNLAFSSLRVPKKKVLNGSFVASSSANKAAALAAHRQTNGYHQNMGKSISSSNSPDRMRAANAGNCSGSTTASQHPNVNGGLTNGNALGGAGGVGGGKSSVWFEYGCI